METLKKFYAAEYNDIFSPKLNRRKSVAFGAFWDLNRERQHEQTPNGLKPAHIKTVDIKAYHSEMLSPISFEHLKIFVQNLDDAFIEFSVESLRNG